MRNNTFSLPNSIKMNYRLYVLFGFLCITLSGCNDLPADLQSRKDACVSKLEDLRSREKIATSMDYKELAEEFSTLLAAVKSYTEDCIKRGFPKDNNKLYKELNEKITKYKELAAQSENNNTNECSICGHDFKGNGYEEVSDGVWERCNEPYQCYICSPACGRKHTQKMNSYIRDGSSDGRIQGEACSLCKGTGIESGWDPVTLEQTGRICPMCNGNGRMSY
jgi:hypothetical protein